jgi:purine nucleoside permease
MSAAESLSHQRIGSYSAYLPSLESAYTVGHAVVRELLRNWPKYRAGLPGTGANAQKP